MFERDPRGIDSRDDERHATTLDRGGRGSSDRDPQERDRGPRDTFTRHAHLRADRSVSSFGTVITSTRCAAPTRIHAVIVNGRLITKGQIETILADIEKANRDPSGDQ